MTKNDSDPRPAVWVGHTVMGVPDVAKTVEFMIRLGTRLVEQGPGIGILELRGGTHLLLMRSEDPVPSDATAPFDLMVEDVDAAHAEYKAAGLAPSAIEAGPHHRAFTVTAPSGHRVTINSSHVIGPV